MQDDAGLTTALSGAIGRQHVVTAADDQEPYLVDWRGRCRGRAVAVVKPASTEEVATVVRLCAERGVLAVCFRIAPYRSEHGRWKGTSATSELGQLPCRPMPRWKPRFTSAETR